LKNFLEDDDTEASAVLEKLKPMLSGSQVWKELLKVEKLIADYEFEEALEQLENVSASLTVGTP
ncbi:MAG: hypothetical protein HQM13_24210, partial [SAR324 cluster bacterium]|nr:hypothetical protein [SAR324 cluster bacterium]